MTIQLIVTYERKFLHSYGKQYIFTNDGEKIHNGNMINHKVSSQITEIT